MYAYVLSHHWRTQTDIGVKTPNESSESFGVCDCKIYYQILLLYTLNRKFSAGKR